MDVFAALADPVRRELVVTLARGAGTVGALAAAHPISRPAVSRHLRLLREAGLVTATRVGRQRVHELDRDGLEPVRALLGRVDGASARLPAHRLDALDLEVRRTVRERRGAAAPGTTTEEDTG